MASDPVSVCIPVLNGGSPFVQTLDAVNRQQLDRPLELLVADSGSTDGSADLARAAGATVIDIPPGTFSHGGTRNLLAERSTGSHIAFLTQDSTPADELWLARLLEGFELADDVALVFGPYRARPDASPMVRREVEDWVTAFSPDGRPRLDRAAPGDLGAGLDGDAAGTLRASFFSNANGCVARWAWERVPFREVAYAEDRLLAHDILCAGYAKAYQPAAAVIHSHDYSTLSLLRRSFDEWRALREIHGYKAAAGPLRAFLQVQRHVRDDVAALRRDGASRGALAAGLPRSIGYHSARFAGAALGSRADRLPPWVRRAFSLERRSEFEPASGAPG